MREPGARDQFVGGRQIAQRRSDARAVEPARPDVRAAMPASDAHRHHDVRMGLIGLISIQSPAAPANRTERLEHFMLHCEIKIVHAASACGLGDNPPAVILQHGKLLNEQSFRLSCRMPGHAEQGHSRPMAKATLTIASRNYGSWSLRGWLLCKLAGLDFDGADRRPATTPRRAPNCSCCRPRSWCPA